MKTPSSVLRHATLGCVTLLGCSDAVADRYDAQVSINIARFGEDERLGAEVTPGVVLSAEAPEDAEVSLRASAPYPSLRLDNGTYAEATFEVTLNNVDAGADVLPRLVSLDAASRRDARCAGESEHPETVLAPISAQLDDEGAVAIPVRLSVTLPRCASYEIDVTLPRSQERWTALLSGSIGASPAALDRVVEVAASTDPDYVHVMGGLALDDRAQPLSAAREALDELSIPHGATPTTADLADPDAWYEAFGQTDFVASIGALRWLALETSSGRVSAGQLAWLESLETGSRPTVAAMSRPAVDAIGVALDGLRSTQQGGRVMELLRTRGARWLVSSASDAGGATTFAGVEMRDLARVGGAEPDLLVMEVLRPWPALRSCAQGCDATETCVRGFCREACERDADCFEVGTACDTGRGLCRVACADDAACPGPAPACETGWCALEPEVRFSPAATR